ncbi:MAG: substrate-binding domain-containing protein [Thermodesulfobacteriota bacterium]
MKFNINSKVLIFIIPVLILLVPPSYSDAEESVKFSCSAQIAEALGKDVLKIVKEKTGLEIDLKIVASETALNRLENGFADIAAVTEPLSYEMLEKGYVSIPFCKDPVAVIVNKEVKADNLKNSEVKDIFSGSINNWKEISGQDLAITKVIPREKTGAYKNFESLFMGMKPVKYDFMTYSSVTSLFGVKSINGSVSFLSHGAASKADGIKILKIDGNLPSGDKYEYFQTLSFVTKGKPKSRAKEIIDIALSDNGQKLMQEKGMIPILP